MAYPQFLKLINPSFGKNKNLCYVNGPIQMVHAASEFGESLGQNPLEVLIRTLFSKAGTLSPLSTVKIRDTLADFIERL